MRSSTLISAATLPALIVGCLFSTAAVAAPQMTSSALREIDTVAIATAPYRHELDTAFAVLAVASAALLIVRLAASIGRWVTGPRLRVQEEVD